MTTNVDCTSAQSSVRSCDTSMRSPAGCVCEEDGREYRLCSLAEGWYRNASTWITRDGKIRTRFRNAFSGSITWGPPRVPTLVNGQLCVSLPCGDKTARPSLHTAIAAAWVRNVRGCSRARAIRDDTGTSAENVRWAAPLAEKRRRPKRRSQSFPHDWGAGGVANDEKFAPLCYVRFDAAGDRARVLRSERFLISTRGRLRDSALPRAVFVSMPDHDTLGEKREYADDLHEYVYHHKAVAFTFESLPARCVHVCAPRENILARGAYAYPNWTAHAKLRTGRKQYLEDAVGQEPRAFECGLVAVRKRHLCSSELCRVLRAQTNASCLLTLLNATPFEMLSTDVVAKLLPSNILVFFKSLYTDVERRHECGGTLKQLVAALARSNCNLVLNESLYAQLRLAKLLLQKRHTFAQLQNAA